MPSVCARCHIGKLYVYLCACVCVCVCTCGAYHLCDQENGKVLCLYAYISGEGGEGVSLRTLPCTLTRRRFPIFRPETLDRKAPAFESRRSSTPRVVIPFLSGRPARLLARQRHSCATSEPSYSDKIERILPKRLRLRRPTDLSSLPAPDPHRVVDAVEIFIVNRDSRVRIYT